MTTRMMVVDDSEVDRQLVSGLLQANLDCNVQLCVNGEHALRLIEEIQPDLVVTDLVMPEMDGLELVRAIRQRWPDIPVILLTAHGNETTAVEALDAGAASYVPKSQQSERLLETVLRVLAHAQADHSRRRLETQLNEMYCSYSLDNDPALISALVDQFQRQMAGLDLGDATERIRTCVALEEALLNAMYHGNLEITEDELAEARANFQGGALAKLVRQRRGLPQCRHRKLTVDAHLSSEGARFVVRDEGVGFDYQHAASNRLEEYFDQGHGRGLMLMYSIMDEVKFNEAGNEVTLVKLVSQQNGEGLRETAALQSP